MKVFSYSEPYLTHPVLFIRLTDLPGGYTVNLWVGDVPLEHLSPYPTQDHDKLDFATLFLTTHQKPLPYPSRAVFHTELYHYCNPTCTN